MDKFTLAYIDAALKTSTDDDEEPLHDNYGMADISVDAITKMETDCAVFQRENREDLDACGLSLERQGHNFWMTRNGHGSGFWDEDGDETLFRRLTDASHKAGTCDLYLGDDRKIYAS